MIRRSNSAKPVGGCKQTRGQARDFLRSDAQLEEEDSDAVTERLTAMEASPHQDHVVLVQDLSKIYNLDNDKNRKIAVNRLSFHVKKGECFGLLGMILYMCQCMS